MHSSKTTDLRCAAPAYVRITIFSSAADSARNPPGNVAMQVGSFGVNGHVKLPGPTQQQPNVYNFGTPYQTIYNDLKSKDEGFYEQKGLLQVAALSFRASA